MQPTLPQQTVLDTIFQDLNQNFVVQGVPGAGKTTLISMVANRFLELGVTDILALTFSRSLAEDMGRKLQTVSQKLLMLTCMMRCAST